MGQTTAYQAKSNSNDSIFGMALMQAFMGFSFGPEVDMAWEAAETASTIYTDRHSSSVQNGQRANGKIELGVKNSLAPVFGRQTHPRPTVEFDDLVPFWLKNPAPARGRAAGYNAAF
jgi:hypothetical protein